MAHSDGQDGHLCARLGQGMGLDSFVLIRWTSAQSCWCKYWTWLSVSLKPALTNWLMQSFDRTLQCRDGVSRTSTGTEEGKLWPMPQSHWHTFHGVSRVLGCNYLSNLSAVTGAKVAEVVKKRVWWTSKSEAVVLSYVLRKMFFLIITLMTATQQRTLLMQTDYTEP